MSRLPDDIESLALLDEGAPVQVAPVAEPLTVRQWLRQNLFSTWVNATVTVLVGIFTAWLLWGLLRWAFVSADWGVFKANLTSYMIGRFPREEAWRVWTVLYFAVALSGLSFGAFGKRLRWTAVTVTQRAAVAAVTVLLLFYLLDSSRVWVLLLGGVAMLALAAWTGKAGGEKLRRPVLVLWLLAFPIVVLILSAFDGVPPLRWGGFMLNMMVAFVAIAASFPFGILLALGRRSTLRVIRLVCVGFIEVIRGAPLFTWLLFGFYVVPLLLPPSVGFPTLARIILMFTVFSSAYVAEIVRGGLQGVPSGQIEAGRALGLPIRKQYRLVILPQALRSTIPAMISHFISLFKDTSLLAVVAGFTDLLRSARRASAGLEFIGHQKEALLPAALIFWVVAFSMSRWSQRLERRLGVGER